MHCYGQYWNILQAAEGHESHNTNLKVQKSMGDMEYFEQIWNTLEDKINVTWVKECCLRIMRKICHIDEILIYCFQGAESFFRS